MGVTVDFRSRVKVLMESRAYLALICIVLFTLCFHSARFVSFRLKSGPFNLLIRKQRWNCEVRTFIFWMLLFLIVDDEKLEG